MYCSVSYSLAGLESEPNVQTLAMGVFIGCRVPIAGRQRGRDRHTDQLIAGSHKQIFFPHRESDPFLPGDRTNVFLALDIKAGRSVGGHLPERVLGTAHIDGLPVAVQHQND